MGSSQAARAEAHQGEREMLQMTARQTRKKKGAQQDYTGSWILSINNAEMEGS